MTTPAELTVFYIHVFFPLISLPYPLSDLHPSAPLSKVVKQNRIPHVLFQTTTVAAQGYMTDVSLTVLVVLKYRSDSNL